MDPIMNMISLILLTSKRACVVFPLKIGLWWVISILSDHLTAEICQGLGQELAEPKKKAGWVF
jgi:hypothetical protein